MTTQMNAAVNEVRKLLKQGKPMSEALRHAVQRYGVSQAELRHEVSKARNMEKDATFAFRYGSSTGR